MYKVSWWWVSRTSIGIESVHKLNRGKTSNPTRCISGLEMAQVAQFAWNDVIKNGVICAFEDVLLQGSSPGPVARNCCRKLDLQRLGGIYSRKMARLEGEQQKLRNSNLPC